MEANRAIGVLIDKLKRVLGHESSTGRPAGPIEAGG